MNIYTLFVFFIICILSAISKPTTNAKNYENSCLVDENSILDFFNNSDVIKELRETNVGNNSFKVDSILKCEKFFHRDNKLEDFLWRYIGKVDTVSIKEIQETVVPKIQKVEKAIEKFKPSPESYGSMNKNQAIKMIEEYGDKFVSLEMVKMLILNSFDRTL
ncbi:uncharacterized protein LOC126904351 [Daktulosphaira vitifoliae]|uniref:uncharacterized protein LOC126904351 n=1 Tax=Daktulosphaira vitifoliae TaxID=58002 RepID=UPI0021AABB03|nr:uncharacterized protein LOC126904351 [Daktulosphaira vitifoliae]